MPIGTSNRRAIAAQSSMGRQVTVSIGAATLSLGTLSRDTLIADATPIDYLDFASPVAGLGSKMGIDATNKWPGETTRTWGTPIAMSAEVRARVDALWPALGL